MRTEIREQRRERGTRRPMVILRWLVIAVGAFAAIQLGFVIDWWWCGIRGLDQWPKPYGRFYKRWMRLPKEAGGYYEWLAQKMGNREPWQTWADAEKLKREAAPMASTHE